MIRRWITRIAKEAIREEVDCLYEALNEIHEAIAGSNSESCRRHEANLKKLEASIRASQHIN